MQTTGTLEEINIDYKTGKPKISFLIDGRDKLSDIEQLKGLKLKIEAKKYIKKRTTNANNYFWKLLQELCELAEIDTVEEYKRRVKDILMKNNINSSCDYVIILRTAIIDAEYDKINSELIKVLKGEK
jgi:hypothetical protein